MVIGFIVNSKSKKNKKNKSKQALRKKVANEKLSSYPSLLGIDDNNSLKSSEQTWTEDGKLISHRSIAYLPPDFDNSYKDSDVAQRQYNENLYKKARFQRLGNFVSSSVMYDDSGSTDSDVCNDIISTPHSMTEYDSYRSGSESGSYAGHHRGNISSSSSDNSSSKAGPTMPYFSRLLNIRQKQDQQVERRASISSVVPPRFNENTSWKPRRKGAPSRSPVGYVPEVKPMKSTFPQSLEGLSDGNRTCADDDDDDDDDDGDYDEGTSSSEVSGSKTDSSSSSSSPPESGLVSPQPPAATVSPFVPESRGSGGRRGRVLIDTSQSPSPPLMSNKTGIIIN